MSLGFADIQAAAARLKGVARRTPALTSTQFDLLLGGTAYFKAENLQRTGAFKFRGAYNALSQFSPEQCSRGVVTYSSGNHAQAIALAASILGMPSVIVMPLDAPIAKLTATKSYQKSHNDSRVVMYDRVTENRAEIANKLMEKNGMTLIPPYDHEHVMAGQGTVALELIEQMNNQIDVLFVCVGGGGLLSGCSVAAKAMCPDVRIIGVEPEAGNDTQQSLLAGEVISIATPDTICDGAQTQFCGSRCFPLIQRNVSEIVTVSDAEVVEMMKFFAERMKMVVEPTGCLAAAAALKLRDQLQGKRVGITISGGNVDLERFCSLINP